ncbi:hypothetical protein MNBD_GAMMA06-2 [hydrothermal vent metagenome]|uniref:tRNA/rRNA methyltransferase SpoU type domain-containing protein n=1 Tax=hydrothermal vent metagenome TaxID=652676 RepID=A0A3B0WSK0_9ZZZZ
MKKNTQLTHKEHQATNHKFPLSIIANDLCDPLNVGSLFRLSDALGIEKLYLCGDTAVPPNTKINKTARSADKHVTFEYHKNAKDLVSKLKVAGEFIIALELTSSSIDVSSNEFSTVIKSATATAKKNKKLLCLVLGSENTGVSENLLSLAELTVHIKMRGHNSSMNVISAASIACYEITRNI